MILVLSIKLEIEMTDEIDTILVGTEALRQVLEAFIGGSHLIMELYCTISPTCPDNPVTILINQFNNEMEKRRAERSPDASVSA